jgi:hypothetical protein
MVHLEVDPVTEATVIQSIILESLFFHERVTRSDINAGI